MIPVTQTIWPIVSRNGTAAARDDAGEGGELSVGGAGEEMLGGREPGAEINFYPQLLQTGAAMAEAIQNPSAIAKLIQSLQNPQVSDTDKWLAVARGGAGMAASRNPTFLGAFGEGAGQGIDAYQRSRRNAAAFGSTDVPDGGYS